MTMEEKSPPVDLSTLSKTRDANWPTVLFYIHVHLVSLYGIWLLIFEAKLLTILFLVLLVSIAILGVTVGAHRLWAHTTYQASTGLRITLMLFQTLAGQGTIYDWVHHHRLHHAYFKTESDPHNSTKGFLYAHFLTRLQTLSPHTEALKNAIDMSDLHKDEVVMFQKRRTDLRPVPASVAGLCVGLKYLLSGQAVLVPEDRPRWRSGEKISMAMGLSQLVMQANGVPEIDRHPVNYLNLLITTFIFVGVLRPITIFYWVLYGLFFILIPLNAPLEYWDESILCTAFIIGGLRYGLVLHTSWLCESGVCIWGLQEGEKYPPDSNTVFILNRSYWPEYHYIYPQDYKSGEFGTYGSGCSTAFIRVFAALGLANTLRTLESSTLQRALAEAVKTKRPLSDCLQGAVSNHVLPEDHFLEN